MSSVTYFTTYAAILRLPLSLTEKLLLCLILTFDGKGLKINNSEIGKALNVSPFTAANTLSSLRKRGLIQTEKAGSKYRKIRPNIETLLHLLRSEVDETYLTDLVNLLHLSSSKLPYSLGSKHKEGSKRKESAHVQKPKPHEDTDKGFDRFWTAYPRKEGRKDAAKAWAELSPSPELVETILAAVERRKATKQWIKDNGRYIPKPGTYLNGERWTDEIGGNGELTHDATEEEIAELERQGIL